MTQNGEKCTYLFDGDSIRRKEPTTRKRNYFERLYEREKMLCCDSCPLENIGKLKKREQIRCIVFRAFLLLSISAVMITLICSSFFKIDNVRINGSERYEKEKIVRQAGVTGKNLIFLDEDELEEKLKAEFPYIKKVDVKKNYPNGITLEVTDNEASYYCSVGGEYCILSAELDVLETNADEADLSRLVKLELENIKSARAGKKLVLDDEAKLEEMSGLTKKISTHRIFDKVTQVDFDKTDGIKLSYDSRLTVVLGNDEEIDVKMTLACAYIDTIADSECGVVYANSTKTGSFLPQARSE